MMNKMIPVIRWSSLLALLLGLESSLCISTNGQDDSDTAGAGISPVSLRPEPRHLLAGSAEHCVLHKALLHQGPFPQYVMYKSHIPDLKEFTLCTWHKFYNHSTDHPIFSYSAQRGKGGEIRSWVSNNYHSSYYQMAVNGYTIYRLNYPIRLHKWYHACQSWNGRTGEWQIWVNSERVGRGFYNLLTGKVVKGGGMAVSGQDSKSYGVGFMGEITLVMLYKAALTAGKAYYTHKHHHVHKFHHEDKLGEDDPENTDGGTRVNLSPDVLVNSNGLPMLQLGPGGAPGQGPKKEGILIGMQLEPRLPVDELAVKPGLNLLKAADILGSFSNVRLFKREHNSTNSPTRKVRAQNEDEAPVLSEEFDSKKLSSGEQSGSRTRRETNDMQAEADDMLKMETVLKTKDQKKRTAGSFSIPPGFDLSSFYGGKGMLYDDSVFQSPNKVKTSPSHIDDGYVEPAEWEVKSVMSLCSACGEDPFKKANVLSWLESPKKLAAGALFVEANQQCHQF